ncbi:MAG TPA: MATE family efflux transporter [Flavobacteriales bacterium]|nr:MATE family efflux transporter [Flavobacteriales bacterium]
MFLRRLFKVFWESLSGEERDYTAMGMRRAIVLLSIPMIMEMGMEALFALVDTFFVTKLGVVATATVGLTETLMVPVYSIAWGLGMGITAVVARRTGEKNKEGARVAAGQSLLIALICGLLMAIPAVLLAPQLLHLMGAEPEVMQVAVPYARLMLASNLIVTLLFAMNAVFRGAGNPGIALRTLALANGINIVLDPLLIFGVGPFPELGVQGAAVATTTGRSIGVIYLLYNLFRKRGVFEVSLAHLRPVVGVLWGIIKVSLGGIGQFWIASMSWVFLVRIISSFGTVAVGGYMVAVRIIIVALLPAWGMANAAATLVGQNLGARQPDRAARSAWWCGHYNMVFMVVITILFWITAPWIVSFFDQGPEADAHAILALRVISLGYFFYGYGMVLAQALNGAGDSLTPTWLNVVCFWLIEIPLAYGLAITMGLGPIGVFASIAISESILAVLCAIVFQRGKWKLVKV